ncbi:hypothetical protein B0I35DRAFT_263859 [Stachybotrys elegans]|uniref:Uncharacterized protein n=1 Tax=Stachybotrys elegans TaxID=80388 RepID=A0A8K0WR42_9HYPO|nr:hypothetical protein B0I35DRAFT_263859 [Stachybotrys elegans]
MMPREPAPTCLGLGSRHINNHHQIFILDSQPLLPWFGREDRDAGSIQALRLLRSPCAYVCMYVCMYMQMPFQQTSSSLPRHVPLGRYGHWFFGVVGVNFFLSCSGLLINRCFCSTRACGLLLVPWRRDARVPGVC